MVQMMLKLSGTSRVAEARHPQASATLRKLVGWAILASGYAVILAHGLAHHLGR
jgi:hypothetical protein